MEEHYASWLIEIEASAVGFRTTSKLASMLAQRLTFGSAIIITSQPRNMLPAIRKKWLHVLRLLENQRAATRSAAIKAEMKTYEQLLADAPFLIGQPEEVTKPCVFLVEPDDFGVIPPGTATVFVLSELTLPQLLFWSRRLPDEARMVIFRRQPFPAAPEASR